MGDVRSARLMDAWRRTLERGFFMRGSMVRAMVALSIVTVAMQAVFISGLMTWVVVQSPEPLDRARLISAIAVGLALFAFTIPFVTVPVVAGTALGIYVLRRIVEGGRPSE